MLDRGFGFDETWRQHLVDCCSRYLLFPDKRGWAKCLDVSIIAKG